MAVVRRVLIVALGIALAAGVVAAMLFLLAPRVSPLPGNPFASQDSLPTWVPPAPLEKAVAPTGPGNSGLADPAWLDRVSSQSGIPRRALAAYAGQAIVQQEHSVCDIGWNTLAAIGEVESHHGTIDASEVGVDGTVSPPIYGIGLHGEGTDSVPDSDGGAIDADPSVDRAVGPMQTIPQTWRNWHSDASGDGVEDPQTIDDATSAAAHYLCRATDQSMGTEAGWSAGILSYNGSQQYLDDVTRWAVRYAEDAAS